MTELSQSLNSKVVRDVHEHPMSITRDEREHIKGHRGKVIWLTGLSGSGKSTLANMLEIELNRTGHHTYLLDGDNIRLGLNYDLGFSLKDRTENIRRVAEVSRLMMDAGLIVITAFISPIAKERQRARNIIGSDHFAEVFVKTPLHVCEARDTKGLYKKARAGLLTDMTGINSPYDAPSNPDFVADCREMSDTEQSVRAIMGSLIPSLQRAP